MRNTMVKPDNYSPVIPPDLSVFEKVDCIVNKKYITHLTDYPILRCPKEIEKRDIAESACLFPIRQIVFDREENNIEKLTSVYSGAAAVEANVVMILDKKDPRSGDMEMYLGVCDENSRDSAYTKAEILYRNLTGNFPGCRAKDETGQVILDKTDTAALINRCFHQKYTAVSSVSGIASYRGNRGMDNESFFQGIEKVIEAMEGRDYSVIIIAKCVDESQLDEITAEQEMLYTRLAPFSKSTLSINEATTEGATKTLSDSLAKTVSNTTSQSLSIGNSRSMSHTEGGQTGTSDSVSVNAGVSIGIPETPVGVHAGGGTSHQVSRSESWSDATTWGESRTESDTTSKTDGQTVTVTMADGSTYSYTKGQTVQLSYENRTVTETLKTIEKQLERLKAGRSLGMFAVTAYFMAPTLQGSRAVASSYKSVISGDASSLESININSWSKTGYELLMPYLKKLCHPVFVMDKNTTVTPASLVTSAELALHMSLPKSAVKGIAVRESVSFGRNIMCLDGEEKPGRKILLGNTYHLGHTDARSAYLDLQSLTMHTFITGTTGAGKSNTVYGILNQLQHFPGDIHFLVVEPAKGEYKDAFAGRNDVFVYGMNPYISPLLRINPFSFPERVHVLEHLDRLLGILNVCWPMYAAMPAVLKDALQRAYEEAGWDLRRSKNRYGRRIFPGFADVMSQVEKIMDESKYSADNKGDYTGALCTRLGELTTGINGMVFVADELSNEELFEQNVIVDLSRIGSTETKALIMGVMVIKLQEYHIASVKSHNVDLKHVTVLEEAHHLLKRTSMEQSQESANLAGRSVEMLTNAFAEMRSYGEGYIIADQAPELMDLSVIRNTNTKIVMRLPEQSDRELVGRSIGLNDRQIAELPKLARGVAAVYQNDWIEAVLVKMPYFDDGGHVYHYEAAEEDIFENNEKHSLLEAIMGNELDGWIDQVDGGGIDALEKYDLPTSVKCGILDYEQMEGREKLHQLAKIAYDFFNTPEVMKKTVAAKNIEDWKKLTVQLLEPSVEEYGQKEIDMLLLFLVREQAVRDIRYRELYYAFAGELGKVR